MTTPGRKAEPTETKFWRKVDKGDGTGCWLWIGTKSTQGYGSFQVRVRSIDGRTGWRLERAHRVAYEMLVGPIPPGAHLLHSCDTPACVRPEHLRPGTMKENIGDMIKRGRMPRGSARAHAVLTEALVRRMRESYAAEPAMSCRMLAQAHGVSVQAVYDAVAGRTWTHVDGPITRRKAVLPTPRKLHERDAEDLVRRYIAGESGRRLAASYSVGISTVWKIIEGATWRRITADPEIRAAIMRRSHRRGHPQRKMIPSIEDDIVARYRFRVVTAKMLAAEYGLHPATVNRIVARHGLHRPRRPHAANSNPRMSFVIDASALIPAE